MRAWTPEDGELDSPTLRPWSPEDGEVDEDPKRGLVARAMDFVRPTRSETPVSTEFSTGAPEIEDYQAAAKAGSEYWTPPAKAEPQAPADSKANRTWAELGTDVGRKFVSGAVSLAGDVGWLARKGVVDPIGRAVEGENYVPNTEFEKATRGITESIAGDMSAKARGQAEDVQKLMETGGWDGFTSTVGYVLENPSMLPGLIAESAAGTASIGAVGARVLKAVGSRVALSKAGETAVAGWATGAAEGIQTLGSVGRQIEESLDKAGVKDPEVRAQAMRQAIPAALATMLAGRYGGGVEAKFFADVGKSASDLAVKGGVKAAAKTVLKDAGKETLEELQQGAGEQFFQNLGEGSAGLTDDLSKGVGANAALSAAAGFAQGGAASIRNEAGAALAPEPASPAARAAAGILGADIPASPEATDAAAILAMRDPSRAPVRAGPTMEEAAAAVMQATSVSDAIAAAGAALDAPIAATPQTGYGQLDLPVPPLVPERGYTGEATGAQSEAFLADEAARELQRPSEGGEPGLAEIAMQGAPTQAAGVISGAPDLGAQQAEAVAKRARGELLSSREVELAKEFDAKPAPKIVIAGRETDVGEASDAELSHAANLTRSAETRQIIVEEQRRRQEAPSEPPRLALPDNRAASGETLVTFPDGSAMPAAEARARQLQTPDTQAGARKVSVPSSQSQDEALAVKRAAYAAAKASGAPDDIAASMVLNFQEKANERGEPMSVWVNDRDGALGMAPASGAPAWKNGKYVGTFYPDGGKAGKAPASLAPERLAAMTPKGLEAALKQAKTPEAKAAIAAEQQRRGGTDIAMAEPGESPLASRAEPKRDADGNVISPYRYEKQRAGGTPMKVMRDMGVELEAALFFGQRSPRFANSSAAQLITAYNQARGALGFGPVKAGETPKHLLRWFDTRNAYGEIGIKSPGYNPPGADIAMAPNREAPKASAIDRESADYLSERAEAAPEERATSMDIARGERKVGEKGYFERGELQETRDIAENAGRDADEVEAEVRRQKARHPVSDGWAPLRLAKVDPTKTKVAEAVTYKIVPWTFHLPPGVAKASKILPAPYVEKLASGIVKEVRETIKAARSGDKSAQAIVDQMHWYRDFTKRLRSSFGGFGDMFADLIGATSAMTDVKQNYKNASEIATRFLNGEFDVELRKLEKHLAKGGKIADFPSADKIRSLSGQLFGVNSPHAMRALLGIWREAKTGSAPKTRNFAANLAGTSIRATIDSWAARTLQRLAGKPRIPPKAEDGVGGEHLKDPSVVGGAFGFGQKVFEVAAKKLSDSGVEITPADLQAMMWFREKALWTKNDWTSQIGEEGSLEEEARRRELDRYQGLFSVQQGEEQPGADNVARAVRTIDGVMKADPRVFMYRSIPTKGGYMDFGTEESFDLEAVVDREFDPMPLFSAMVREAKDNNQDSVGLSRVVRPDEDNANARPGIEVSLLKDTPEADVLRISNALRNAKIGGEDGIGAGGFTLAVDPRKRRTVGNRPAGEYVGIRVQFVPEIFIRSYHNGYAEGPVADRIYDDLTSGNEARVQKVMQEAEAALDATLESLRNDPAVAYAEAYDYDTLLVGKEDYDGYAARESEETNREDPGNEWPGQSAAERLRGAARRHAEANGIDPRSLRGGGVAAEQAGEGQLRLGGGQLEREGADGDVRQEVAPLASRAQTKTPAFKRWFRDSKVVDEKGEPLVVYHGTENDFSKFRVGSEGIFFAASPETANTYTDPYGGNIMPVYLSIRAPLRITWREWLNGKTDDGLNLNLEGVRGLKKRGYDGVILTNPDIYDPAISSVGYIAFRPEQIKSAIGNSGNFDPANPDILASQAFPVPQVSAETPVFNSREQQPDAVTAVGVRFGHEKRTSLNGRSYGKGVPGQESLRIQSERDPELRQRLLNRVYFYAQTADELPRSESIITGNNVSRVKLTNLYDLSKDPRGLYARAKSETDSGPEAANRVEQLIMEAGFDGYVNRNSIPSPALVLLDIPGDIPAEYLGYRYQANEKLKATAPKTQYDEVHHETIRKAIADGIAKFGGKGTSFADGTKVNIVPTEREVPAGALQTWLSEQGDGSIEGFYDPGSKEIWIITKNLSTPERAVFVATAHEVLHAGLRKTLGAENIDPVLRQIHARNKRVREQAAIRMSRGMPLVEAVEETLADMPDRSELKGWDKLLKAIKDFLAKIGIVRWTDEQVETLVAASRAAVREGGPQTVASTEEAIAASERAPIFYSELSRQIAAAKSEKMPAPQWKAWLQNQQGIKKDELQWSGILDWLDTPAVFLGMKVSGKPSAIPIPKQQLLDYLANNGVQVQDVMLGEGRKPSEELRRLAIETMRGLPARPDGWVGVAQAIERKAVVAQKRGDDEEALRLWGYVDEAGRIAEGIDDDGSANGATKFQSYTLPGGTNYRELLLTLSGSVEHQGIIEAFADRVQGWRDVDNDEAKSIVREILAGTLDATRAGLPKKLVDDLEAVRDAAAHKSAYFRSSHFPSIDNIVAHVRFNERTDANGKRILFIEEIQSDWAQKGKKEGFASGSLKAAEDAYTAEIDRLAEKYGVRKDAANKSSAIRMAADKDDLKRLIELNDKVVAEKAAIPSAPFVTKTDAWVALALKRMIRYASDNGFDGIAWTTGEQQADRYDLSRQVERIEYSSPAPDGKRYVDVKTADGDHLMGGTYSSGEIEAHVGKEVAKKIDEDPSDGVLRGLDLKVGGEGMKGFYDKIVPGVARDVLKKVGGGSVASVSFRPSRKVVVLGPNRDGEFVVMDDGAPYSTQPTKAEAESVAQRLRAKIDPKELGSQPGFYLTPEMKAKAQQGLPLMSKRDESTPASEEDADLDFTPRGLGDIAGQLGKSKGAMKQKRVDEFASSRGMTRHLQLLEALARNTDTFQFGDSTKTDWEGIAKDMGLTSITGIRDGFDPIKGKTKVIELGTKMGRRAVRDPDGTEKIDDDGNVVMETGPVPMNVVVYFGQDIFAEGSRPQKTIWVDSSTLQTGKGGKEAYQLAYTWAARNGHVLVPDPNGVSPAATEARIGSMLSAAMRLGTTKFMWPVEQSDVAQFYGWQHPKWFTNMEGKWKWVDEPGSEADQHNKRLLIEAAIGIVEHKLAYGNDFEKNPNKKFRDPETGEVVKLEDLEYNLDFDEIVWRDTNEPVSKRTLDALLDQILPVGVQTLRRGSERGRPGDGSRPAGAGKPDVDQAKRTLGEGPRATLARALLFRSIGELSPQDVSRYAAQFAGGKRPVAGTPLAGILASRRPDWVESGSADLKSAAAKVDTYAPGKTFKQKLDELKTNWAERFVQGVFDAYAPLKRLGRKEYILARMVKSADASLEATLLYGKPRIDADGVIHGDIDKKGFIGHMQDLNGEHDRFFMWVAGQRAGRLFGEGRENLFTREEIAEMRRLDEGKMKDGTSRKQAFAKAQEALNAYNKAVLDIAEKTGLIDGEARKNWEHDFYVPFFRVNEDMKIDGPSKVKGLVRQKAFEKLKGGKENLGDLLDNTLRNWSHLLSASLANQAALASLKAATRVGIATDVPQSAAQSMVKSAGVGGATFAMDGGVQHWFIVDDPQVLDAISAVESASFKGLPMELMGKFKHYLTLGVTVSPTFRIRNLMRDSISAIAQNDLSYNMAGNVWRGFKAMDKEGKDYAEALFNGALIRFGQLTDGKHAEHAKRLILSGVDDQTILDTPQKAKAALGKMWDWWQETGDKAENVNRMSRYMQGLARGESALEAAFAARDMMDFSLQGSWTATRFLTQIVPFMNARLQGMYKLGRSAKEDPARMGYVVAATALASIALLLAYKDDDEWKKREDWDRDNFWWFRIGNTAYRIPKPFEIGAMGTLAERSVELAISDEMTGKRFAERLRSMLGDTLALNPTPQLFKPMVDIYANKDSFSGRMIENRGMENLTKPERAGPNTSLVAKTLGKAGEVTQLSPVQIDHLIRSYFGWLGSHAAMTVDLMAQPFTDVEKPARKLGDVFVLGDFVKDLPSNRSRYVEDFYKQAKVVHEVMGDLKRAREVGDMAKVREIMEERRDDIALSRLYIGAERNIGELNRRIRVVRGGNLSAEMKRQRLDELEAQRAKLAEHVERLRASRRAAKRSPALSE